MIKIECESKRHNELIHAKLEQCVDHSKPLVSVIYNSTTLFMPEQTCIDNTHYSYLQVSIHEKLSVCLL